MAVLSKIKSYPSAVDYFKDLPFYNKLIEKPKHRSSIINHRLKNIDQLAELPFFEQLSVIKQIKRLEGMQCRAKLKQLKEKIQFYK